MRTSYIVKASDVMSSAEFHLTKHLRPYQSHSPHYNPKKPEEPAPAVLTAAQQKAAKIRAKEREAMKAQRSAAKKAYRALKAR